MAPNPVYLVCLFFLLFNEESAADPITSRFFSIGRRTSEEEPSLLFFFFFSFRFVRRRTAGRNSRNHEISAPISKQTTEDGNKKKQDIFADVATDFIFSVDTPKTWNRIESMPLEIQRSRSGSNPPDSTPICAVRREKSDPIKKRRRYDIKWPLNRVADTVDRRQRLGRRIIFQRRIIIFFFFVSLSLSLGDAGVILVSFVFLNNHHASSRTRGPNRIPVTDILPSFVKEKQLFFLPIEEGPRKNEKTDATNENGDLYADIGRTWWPFALAWSLFSRRLLRTPAFPIRRPSAISGVGRPPRRLIVLAPLPMRRPIDGTGRGTTGEVAVPRHRRVEYLKTATR